MELVVIMDRPIAGVKSVAGADGGCPVSKEAQTIGVFNIVAGGDGLRLLRREAAWGQ